MLINWLNTVDKVFESRLYLMWKSLMWIPTSQTQVVYLLLLMVSTFLCTLIHHYVLQGPRHSNAQTQMNTSTQQLPIHFSILGIQFSLGFSSAFPNGWLNQLCGAWFKSLGMLARCQRQVDPESREEKKLLEESSSPLPLASLKSASIKMYLRSTEQIQFNNFFVSTKRPAVIQHTHTHTGMKTLPVNLWKHTLSFCKHTQKYQKANTITTTFTESHTVLPSTRELHGKRSRIKNIKALCCLIIKEKCSTMTQLGFLMVFLCFSSPEKLSLNLMSETKFLSYDYSWVHLMTGTECLHL